MILSTVVQTHPQFCVCIGVVLFVFLFALVTSFRLVSSAGISTRDTIESSQSGRYLVAHSDFVVVLYIFRRFPFAVGDVEAVRVVII